MNAILGAPWLRSVSPAIDWSLLRIVFEHLGNVVTVYGRGGGPPPPSPPRPMVELVSCKRFLRDLERSGGLAYVGLLSDNAPTTSAATCATACSAAHQPELDALLAEFSDVFEAPGAPPATRVKHRIDLVDETKPPPRHRVYRMS